MEARILKIASLAILLLASMGAQQRTANFIVETDDPAFARQVSQAAEQYRRDLAVSWLGKAMPNWSQPCMLTVTAGPRLEACGATTFVFSHGEVYDWRMKIQGSRERVLDSVLPHEITHMIFACRFSEPLPRWADEGGATSVEHASEKNKYREMLPGILRSNRGIAFNQMFAIMEYPPDYMSLYAQGYSLAEYLIQQGGRRKYVEFIDDGLKSDNWPAAVERHYGVKGLGALQNTWLAWVRQGSPLHALPAPPAPGELIASNRQARPEPNLVYHVREEAPARKLTPIYPMDSAATAASAVAGRNAEGRLSGESKVLPAAGWQAAGKAAPAAPASSTPTVDPFTVSTQVAHPQPLEQPRQTVLR